MFYSMQNRRPLYSESANQPVSARRISTTHFVSSPPSSVRSEAAPFTADFFTLNQPRRKSLYSAGFSGAPPPPTDTGVLPRTPAVKQVCYNPVEMGTINPSRRASECSFKAFDTERNQMRPSEHNILSSRSSNTVAGMRQTTEARRGSSTGRPNILPETTNNNMAIKTSVYQDLQNGASVFPAPQPASRNLQNGTSAFQAKTSNMQTSIYGPKMPTDNSGDPIKKRLCDYFYMEKTKQMESGADTNMAASAHNHSTSFDSSLKTPKYIKELARRFQSAPAIKQRQIAQSKDPYGTYTRNPDKYLLGSVDSSMTRSEYQERGMDYRNMNGEYTARTLSAVTSPNAMRSHPKSTGQPSPSSVIEELQGRFYNTGRISREKRPVLRSTNPTAADLSVSAFHRQNVVPQTSRATLASRPHHQSELTLSSTISPSSATATSAFEAPIRPITTASTAKLGNAPPERYDCRGGPSYRRLQTLYGPSTPQKRYPSDNDLDKPYLDERSQLRIPERKSSGTIKIQVRSRSAQVSPNESPHQIFKSPTAPPDSAADDRIRSRQVILPQSVAPQANVSSQQRARALSSSVDGPQQEDEEGEKLPTVRDIIRQVEDMTLKNNISTHNSTTTLSRSGLAEGGTSSHVSRSFARPVHFDSMVGANRSQSTSSIHSNGGRKPSPPSRQVNPESVFFFGQGDQQRSANGAYDYYPKGLLEAFLDQRKELQQLRKEMAEKERRLVTLEKDLRMYEPWRTVDSHAITK